MFEHFDNPRDAYQYKLGAALTMEQTVLEILEDAIESAQSSDVRRALTTHRDETQGHIERLEQVFGAFEWAVDTSPCPAIDGLKSEAKAMVKKTDESIVDQIILQGCVEVEHHELGVYQNLLLQAKALGREDVADILRPNFENESETLKKVIEAQAQLAAAGALR